MSQSIIPLDFAKRHVLIFGGTTGINLGIAQAFHARGANVVVASRKSENVAAAVATMQGPNPAHGVVADIRDDAVVERAVAEAVAKFGTIDVLIQGAAGNFLAAAKDLSSNGFKVVVDIDLNGTFHVMRRAYPHLAKPGAAVINISAPQAFVPIRWQVHVCAAKAGVDQITRVLALEWGPDGIRVNSISPGPIAGTEGVKRLMPGGDDGVALAAKHVPLGRMGEKSDIANLALFLASPYASYLSGAVIPCDGGGAFESVKISIESAGSAMAAAAPVAQS
jgi:NAD(P)-dependent dehydrogenase (short-subunit alcohol dehydrogenase family)